jgi:hypothetical protein
VDLGWSLRALGAGYAWISAIGLGIGETAAFMPHTADMKLDISAVIAYISPFSERTVLVLRTKIEILQRPTMNTLRKMAMPVMGVLALLAFPVLSAAQGRAAQAAAPDNAPRSIAPYFTPATSAPKAPDAQGFLQRWLLLEPINKPNRTNTVFTDTYVRAAFNTEYFPNQFTVVPKNGDRVKVGDQELAWHALDSANFDVKLFRFAYGLNKTTYGVIFWAVTVANSPREMQNVRLAVGSNAASMWWLNGKEAVDLFTDRRMKMDDCVSKRLTLNKGRNVIRGAVINGPGLSDFCVRFIDENGAPIKDITLSLDSAGN